MAGKTYLITGANRGLGLELARQISASSSDSTIYACVRSLQGELDDLNKLTASSSRIHVIECDTSSIASIQACGAQVSESIGKGRLDYLVNNAGINAVPERTSLDVTGDELRQHMDVNVVGPAEVIKALGSHFGEGSVIMNITSGLGSFGKAIINCTAYAVSKAALNMLTMHQADALRRKGVSAIMMDPGSVKTRMGGAGAVLTPEESVTGMLKVLHSVTVEDSGKFYQWDGDIVPW